MSILITRPSPAGEQLVQQLVQMGLSASHFPLLDFVAGRGLATLPALLCQLREGDLLFALSQQVVNFAHQPLRLLPRHVLAFAPGRGSALALQHASGLTVSYPEQSGDSERLLALPALQQVVNKQALILRGNGGRELIANTLTARGARVRCCECYQRRYLAWQGEQQANYWQQQSVNTLVVTSGDMLHQLFHHVPVARRGWLLACRLVVVSNRLARLGRMWGWQEIIIADNADNDALLRILQSLS